MRIVCSFLCLIFAIGCYSYNDDDEDIRGVFENINTQDKDSTPPIIEPATVVNNQPVQHDEDTTGPQLVESTVESGRIEPKTDVISLRFNENISKIDIKLLNDRNNSLKWIPSIDTITNRRVILTRINGNVIHSDNKYYIKGFVEDKNGNKTSIDIEFRAVEKNRDRFAPQILTSSIWHKATNVSINTDQIVFTFNEDIKNAEAKIVRGKNWNTGQDLKWDRFIDRERVVLVKITGKSLSLRKANTYTISIKASDASGNWTPADNRVWVYEFTTQIK